MLPLIPIIAIGAAAAIGIRKLVKSQKSASAETNIQKWLKSIGCTDEQLEDFSPDMRDPHDYPILIRAILDYQNDIVGQLLNAGANPNVHDINHVPAICFAAQKSLDKALIRMFAKANADMNAMDSDGKNAIFYAQNVQTLEQLINAGALVDAIDKNGKTPLFSVRHPEMLTAFLNNGADVNHRDINGQTPIFYIHDLQLLKVLASQNAKFSISDNTGKTPLFYAESTNEAIFLMSKGVDPTIRDKNDQIADILLHPYNPKYTISFDTLQASWIIDIIRQKNLPALEILDTANVLQKTTLDDYTIVEEAIQTKDPQIALIVLKTLNPLILKDFKQTSNSNVAPDSNISINDPNAHLTGIIKKMAFQNDMPEICQFMQDTCGKSFEFWRPDNCIINHKPRIFTWLMKRNAQNMNPADRETTLKYYLNKLIQNTDNIETEFIQCLFDIGLNPNTKLPALSSSKATNIPDIPAITKAIQFNKANIVQAILDHGTLQPSEAQTHLKQAFEMHNPQMIAILLKAGATPDIQLENGQSLLEYLIVEGEIETAQILINAKAKLNYPGRSLLVKAINNNLPVHFIEFLIQSGADLHEADAEFGLTPMLAAKSLNNQEIVELLINAGA